jgi:hypothetical protein
MTMAVGRSESRLAREEENRIIVLLLFFQGPGSGATVVHLSSGQNRNEASRGWMDGVVAAEKDHCKRDM